MNNKQTSWGILNKQNITNIVVNEKYLQDALSLANNPSFLNKVIVELFENLKSNAFAIDVNTTPHPDVRKKIVHNNIKKYRFKIEELYSENAHFIDSAYDSLDYLTPGNKNLLLNYLNSLYLEVLGGLSDDYEKSKIEIIRDDNNGDLILEIVINKLLISVSKLYDEIPREYLIQSVTIIVYHAFVECKILENPNK